MVMLVILAVICYLAMNNFKSTAPSAMAIQRHNTSRKVGQDAPVEDGAKSQSTSASADAWNPSPPARPSLDTVDRNTSQHAGDVKDALKQTD